MVDGPLTKSPFPRRHLSYANVVATLALVFAMSGGALAANHYLLTSTRQVSPKVLSALKGKTGPAGKAGAVGSAGAQGPEGKAGANGVGVTSRAFEGAAGSCTQGGSEFTAANGTTFACNGTNGREPKEPKEPKEGSLGPPSTLPADRTETGAWTISTGAGNPVAAISFEIPLAAALGEMDVHYVEAGGNGTTCQGDAKHPEARPGSLCVYQVFTENIKLEGGLAKGALIINASEAPPGTLGAAPSGALVHLTAETGATSVYAYGTWAVTGEEY